ncbi:MAG: MotA/TolQ/ExbB proton channel family protein [Candidatus Methylacidiphilales bacterium]
MAAPSTTTPISTDAPGVHKDLVTVNWGEELIEGGVTMLALGLLSVAMLAFAAERLIMFKTEKFVPPRLLPRLLPLFQEGEYDRILSECKTMPSTLARAVVYAVNHRHLQADMLMQNTSDVVAREMCDQEERCMPFSVIAALAPLLGLLGTMIGMIEAFKLVEVFGDEGGASLLAGSISKALITTAVGLILAIPSIALYYYFKNRLHKVTQKLEIDLEELFSQWFLKFPSPSQPEAEFYSVEEPGTEEEPANALQ